MQQVKRFFRLQPNGASTKSNVASSFDIVAVFLATMSNEISSQALSTSVEGRRDKLVTVVGHQFITLTEWPSTSVYNTVGWGTTSRGSVSGSGDSFRRTIRGSAADARGHILAFFHWCASSTFAHYCPNTVTFVLTDYNYNTISVSYVDWLIDCHFQFLSISIILLH